MQSEGKKLKEKKSILLNLTNAVLIWPPGDEGGHSQGLSCSTEEDMESTQFSPLRRLLTIVTERNFRMYHKET